MPFSFIVPDFFKSVAVAIWGVSGVTVTIPVAYVAGSAPYWETSWRPGLNVSEPILVCADNSGQGNFKVYLRLKRESTKDDPNRVVFHNENEFDDKPEHEGSDASLSHDWSAWDFSFDAGGRITAIVHGSVSGGAAGRGIHENIECSDSKIRYTATGGGQKVDFAKIQLKVVNKECVKKVSQIQCDIKFSLSHKPIDWIEGFRPQLVYYAF